MTPMLLTAAETRAGGTDVQAERTRAVDWDLVLSSLSFTRMAFESYDYRDEDLRRQRLADVDRTTAAIRELKRDKKGG